MVRLALQDLVHKAGVFRKHLAIEALGQMIDDRQIKQFTPLFGDEFDSG